ncbi:NADH-cytochrome b5 reductase-like [Phymastichus coffea]|uniref:NADH-cytochrome b5 reductase-like n=1 Tax=Phymastichus coffea TaxID=108790 RepID=UPI00273C9ED8|nr:NADH-cytochrome b5 reductase-like [Phymastichus coffea]
MIESSSKENDHRPVTPSEEDCCGNSCNPCIFDVHKKLVEEWEKRKLDKIKRVYNENCLSLLQYKRFIVRAIKRSSEDCIIIDIECGSENKNELVFMSPGQHIMMRLTSTSKPYTPISWNKQSIKLLIKLYENGVASNCIKQLKLRDDIFIRGPYGDFKYTRNSYKNVVMLSIGSGIAALYPIAVSIVKDDLEDTKIKWISGFRSLSHVALKDELRALTDYWNFECLLCLSQEKDANITGIQTINSRLNDKIINNVLDSYDSESVLILICGTPEFNASMEKLVVKKNFSNHYSFR